MACCGWKTVAGQAVVIVLIGSAIGIADSRMRPVKLDRKKPEPPVVTPAPPTSTPKPGENTAAEHPSVGTPAAATPAARPSAAFKATTRDELNAMGEKGKGQITLDEAKSLYDQQAVFVDARKAEKYAEAHIKGAYNISEEDFRQGDPAILAMIPRDSKVVVYCTGGQCDESEQVARMLDGSGYTTVYVLHDGIPGWEAMGWATEKGAGQ